MTWVDRQGALGRFQRGSSDPPAASPPLQIIPYDPERAEHDHSTDHQRSCSVGEQNRKVVHAAALTQTAFSALRRLRRPRMT